MSEINMAVFDTDENITEQRYIDLCEHTKQIVDDKCKIIEHQTNTITHLRDLLMAERARIEDLKTVIRIFLGSY